MSSQNEMFLSKFLGRLLILNQNQKKKSPKKPQEAQSKSEKEKTPRPHFNTAITEASRRSPVPSTQDIESTRQLNEELDKIEKRIRLKGANNNLLLKKGELLLSKGKYNQSRKVFNEIIKSKNDRKSSRTARELLSVSHRLQTTNLVKTLQITGKSYNHALINLPKNLLSLSDRDITDWVLDEARRARSADLPKLSSELIELTLNTGKQSTHLLLEKALSLNVMGHKAEALDILEKLQKETKDIRIKITIRKTIENIQKSPKPNLSRVNKYLAIQSNAVAKANSLETKFIPDTKNIKADAKLKSLIYKEALVCLDENASIALSLINSILDYFPKDGASLQLKGEILCILNRSNEALPIWKTLATSKEEEIATKAQESITALLSKKAKQISAKKTPREAILFFIESSFKYNNTTSIDKRIMNIVAQINPSIDSFSDPELRKHQMQLQYNTLVIEYFEEKLRKKVLSDPGAPAQKTGAIRKTALKAG